MQWRLRVVLSVSAAVAMVAVGMFVPAGSQQQYGQQTGSLTLTATTVTPGQVVTASGTGFRPAGTVGITFESAPVSLGTAAANSQGAFSKEVTIPFDAAPGTHTIRATGPTPDNATLVLAASVTVTQGTATTVRSGGLSRTGSSSTMPLVVGAAILVAAGVLLVMIVRRRRTRPAV